METLNAQGDVYSRLARSIAPEIYGMEDVKKALLLLMVRRAGRHAMPCAFVALFGSVLFASCPCSMAPASALILAPAPCSACAGGRPDAHLP